ncbi:RNA polymerase sigma-H factor AlgU [Thermoclostridium stercorarium subsp. stercorarium DSM 8532]|uniref:RNA polymerase sigma factor n=2 Tax=Thermoclostridium stercorarium TaxID=1510 RepID=L7VIR2_THES1|nr:sigma-70 family RNA polymerase sigma factor [Thermoclostridium stercorarium]AGC67960.1 RNA polymerase sigma-H factor AlgU [Thermoclostridium stercorarium subsp. stercorarium DSM 8532]AGI38996.1 RNA polymerase sigma factor [Thermoclostridium stercorarium subsp. stercorarium DSM 8532]ANW98362.1 RNA polymerase subunit sigma-24 [Thermoclostridium stercorarium subsp. thermolacticum DSM 2910]
MDTAEKKLIELSVGGDVEAFETLIQSHQKKVYNIALRMTGNPEDAQELAQEAIVRAFTSIGKFRGDSSFSTWLYRITINICTDFLRKRNKVTLISMEQGAASNDNQQGLQIEEESPGPDGLAEKKQLKKLVRDAMDALSEEHRQVLILRDILNLSYKEIANTLKVNEGTIKSRINRARAGLKKIVMQRSELFKDYVVKYDRKGGIS